jgi:uncharacterized Zn finger protein
MEASEKGDLSSQIGLWLEKKETDRLVARLRRASFGELEDLSHYTTEPAARRLDRSHPNVAAKVYRALGMRIANADKSRYYDAALNNLKRAKICYRKAGLEADWEALVAEVTERHRRKKGFMAGFENIVSGARKRAEPTFLDRARGRWPRGSKR